MSSNAHQPPPKPTAKTIDVFQNPMLQNVHILDGVVGLGRDWNIFKIDECTQLQVHPLIYAQKPTKFKGFPELHLYKQILTLKLARLSSVDLVLLICTETSFFRQGSDLYEIRTGVINAILRSINKLDDASITKQDMAWRLDDTITIHDQQDWNQVGIILPAELEHIPLKHDGKLLEYIKKADIFFMAEELGQQIRIPKSFFGTTHRAINTETRFMNTEYSCIQAGNLIRLAVHYAMDFSVPPRCSDSLIVIPKSEDIKNKLKGHALKYYPFAGIPGYGNVQCKFENQTEGDIHALQIYHRWNCYSEKHDYFNEPAIVERLFAIAKQRFLFTFDETTKKEKFKKPRQLRDKAILRGEPFLIARKLLEILEAGVEVRTEVVHSKKLEKNELDGKTIGSLIIDAFDESSLWLKNRKLGLDYQHHFLYYFDKKPLMEWVNYYMLKCISTLEYTLEKVKHSINKEKITDIESTSYLTTQDFGSAMAAEGIITYFFQGRVVQGFSKIWPQSTLTLLGLNVRNCVDAEFALKNISVEEGRFVLEKNTVPWDTQTWLTFPELLYLQQIRATLLEIKCESEEVKMVELFGNICKYLIGFALAYDSKECQKNAKAVFRKDTSSFAKVLAMSYRPKQPMQGSSKQMSGKTKKVVVSLLDLTEALLKSKPSKKDLLSFQPEVRYVMRNVDNMMGAFHNWNFTGAMCAYLVNVLVNTGKPAMFLMEGNVYVAAVPYRFSCDYLPKEYEQLLEYTYAWFVNKPVSNDVTEKRKTFFLNLSTKANYQLRKNLAVHDLFVILELLSNGKVEEARETLDAKKLEIEEQLGKDSVSFKYLEDVLK